jgi:hypothetical protein
MTKTKSNLEASEEFIRRLLRDSFKQDVDPEALRSAAEKLCEAVPGRQKEAA